VERRKIRLRSLQRRRASEDLQEFYLGPKLVFRSIQDMARKTNRVLAHCGLLLADGMHGKRSGQREQWQQRRKQEEDKAAAQGALGDKRDARATGMVQRMPGQPYLRRIGAAHKCAINVHPPYHGRVTARTARLLGKLVVAFRRPVSLATTIAYDVSWAPDLRSGQQQVRIAPIPVIATPGGDERPGKVEISFGLTGTWRYAFCWTRSLAWPE
jgi:hypothetical protein